MSLFLVRPLFSTLFLLSLLSFSVAACRQDPVPTVAPQATVPAAVTAPPVAAAETPVPVESPIPTPEPAPPTPTPALAALVNGVPILLSTYEKELARYEQAHLELGLNPESEANDYRNLVLDHLIDQLLIEQAAAELNLTVSQAEVDQRLAEMQALTGGEENFAAWLQANQWSEEEFRQALATEMLTELMVGHVTADVPYAVEQVRARYIQVDDAALAQSILEQVRGGGSFAALAQTYSLDRVTGQNGGDLGYFAPGSLLVPEVEAAAFALELDQVSDVIAVTGSSGRLTYYLVQLVDRNPNMPLSGDARYALLQETFESWLAERWSRATIERFVDSG
jgi:parvulin-like peptidyl-prolyl isomerase